MAEAIVRGLLGEKDIRPEQIGVSAPRKERLDQLSKQYGVHTESDNLALCRWANVILLAVKPQIIPGVLAEIAGGDPTKLFISVAAGITTTALESGLGNQARVIRAMPNTPALVQAGATALAAGQHASEADVEIATKLFATVGITEVLSETQIDAVTGVSGSGPAYMFVVIEALSDAGVKLGLPRATALRLAAQTVMGAGKLVLDTGSHPGQLKDMVTSPGGTTIAGLHKLEQGGLRATLINAVEASAKRAAELGKGE